MRKTALCLGIIGLLLSACTSAEDKKAARPDAPFGLAMGDLIPDIQIGSTPDAQGYAVMRSVPKPEVPFVDYAVIVRENVGICRVLAASGNFAVSNDDAVRDRIEAVRGRIEAIYGKPTEVLKSCDGSARCKPTLWANAIAHHARQYAYVWGADDKNVSKTIKQIRLDVRTNEVMEPYVRLDYRFVNEAACAPSPHGNIRK